MTTTDTELRELERRAHDDPDAKSRLETAWVRAGRGWRGERLLWNGRGNMAAEGERGVYRWLVAPLAKLEVELVYVPGGQSPCGHPVAPGVYNQDNGVTLNVPQRYEGGLRWKLVACPTCKGSGSVEVAPFYVGRFPVTWDQFRTFCDAGTEPESLPLVPAWLESLRPEHGRHPVVNVPITRAEAFCAWSGLRLPTAREWEWAAVRDGSFPLDLGRGPRNFEEALLAPPLHRTASVLVLQWDHVHDVGPPGTLGCVGCVRGGKLVPARPEAASWVGAHDMCGNVSEWTAEGHMQGLSFRSPIDAFRNALIQARTNDVVRWGEGVDSRERWYADDVGFRVALSGESNASQC